MTAQASSSASRSLADKELSATLDARLQAFSLVVPTDDLRVQQRLRDLGEPIWTFGERKDDRRSRLREALLREKQRRQAEGEEDGAQQEEEVRSESESEDEVS